MKNFNDLRIGELLEFLQKTVKSNVAQIKEHNKQAQLSLEKGSAGLSEVNELFSKNIKLTADNNNLLQLHNSLLKFFKEKREAMDLTWGLSNYEDSSVEEEEIAEEANSVIEEEFIYKQTIEGEIALDDEHPFAKNEEFLQRLLSHYIENEQYEDCANVQSFLKSVSVEIEK